MLQRLQRIEANLVPQPPVKFHPDRLAVEVALKVQHPRFHRQVTAVIHGGAGTHIGHGGIAAPILKAHPGNVHTVPWHQHMGRRHQIHRGNPNGAADAPPMAHGLGQDVRMAQIVHGPLHLSKSHQPADIGRADSDTPHRDLRDDVAAQPQFRAFCL